MPVRTLSPRLLLTCEHGGNHVPAAQRAAFAGARRALASHRGWDPGALVLARSLARALGAPLLACTTSRLLVDANRSLAHPQLFSRWSRGLAEEERERILARWWRPHRERVQEFVRVHGRPGRPVLHVSVHSFTPRWEGRVRDVDVGLLDDPARELERAFTRAWLRRLRARRADLRLRHNRPYTGTSDGLTSDLRALFGGARYLGVELEVSQRFPRGDARAWRRLVRDLRTSLADTLAPGGVAAWSAPRRT